MASIDLDASQEEMWRSVELVLGDRLPSRVHPEDRSWFTAAEYKQRYGMASGYAREQLEAYVEEGLFESQTQRRGNHNVICYRPRRKDNGDE